MRLQKIHYFPLLNKYDYRFYFFSFKLLICWRLNDVCFQQLIVIWIFYQFQPIILNIFEREIWNKKKLLLIFCGNWNFKQKALKKSFVQLKLIKIQQNLYLQCKTITSPRSIGWYVKSIEIKMLWNVINFILKNELKSIKEIASTKIGWTVCNWIICMQNNNQCLCVAAFSWKFPFKKYVDDNKSKKTKRKKQQQKIQWIYNSIKLQIMWKWFLLNQISVATNYVRWKFTQKKIKIQTEILNGIC